MKQVNKVLSKYGSDYAHDSEAIDALYTALKAEAKQPYSDMEELDDERDFLDGQEDTLEFIQFADQDFKVSENVRVTNPAATWDYVVPVKYIVPSSLKGTINAVRYAESQELKIKVLGSRHSFSNVCQTDGCYFDMGRCHPYQPKRQKKGYTSANHNKAVHKLDQTSLGLLKGSVDSDYCFDVPGGMKIHMINRILCSDKPKDENRFGPKRMYNMGGGDVQSFAGAFSTGTHGTGGTLTAYHDMVLSILLVASDGRVFRVESKSGITDAKKHDAYYASNPNQPQVKLLQDNDLFNALKVNMGCFGIVFSVIIKIKDMDLLKETITYHEGSPTKTNAGWAKIKKLVNEDFLPKDPNIEEFKSININPYKVKNNLSQSAGLKHSKITKTAGETFKENNRKLWPGSLNRLGVVASLVRWISNEGKMPKRRLIETAIRSLDDNETGKGKGYTDKAYKIWNAGTGKLKSVGTGIEFAFPVDQAVDVVDRIIEFLEREGDTGRGYYLNAPMTLRFVRPSDAFLAPNYRYYKGQEVKLWCYIEILRVNSYHPDDDIRELELFKFLQNMMMIHGGRPHWGLNFKFPFTRTILTQLYPEFEKWLKAYHYFSPTGSFDNQLTDSFRS